MTNDSSKNKYLVETRDLTRIYGDGEEIRALDGIDFTVNKGEFVSVMGPSGSGKSTLLNMIGALDKPTSGRVLIDGEDLSKIRNLDEFRANKVGFVFQLHNLIPTLTAKENVEIPMVGQIKRRQRQARSEELLTLVGLSDRMKHLPNQLSGGQRQRVAVARALANNPPLVLADEPTGNLDTTAGTELMQLLQELNNSQGVTFIVVTHDLNVARQTSRVIVMGDGKIIREDNIGTPIEEDLRIWRHSGLGRRIISGESSELESLGFEQDQIETLQDLFQSVNEDD